MLNVRLAGDHLFGKNAVHLAVACDVYDDVFLCCPFFPRDVLDEILNLMESVSEDFSFLLLDAHLGQLIPRGNLYPVGKFFILFLPYFDMAAIFVM